MVGPAIEPSCAKHRMRLVTLYFHVELENLMVAGTTNRSEAMTGFVVKWHDNVAGAEPVLPPTVRLPGKAPSPDLMPGITDEARWACLVNSWTRSYENWSNTGHRRR